MEREDWGRVRGKVQKRLINRDEGDERDEREEKRKKGNKYETRPQIVGWMT
jgi:hypothetical protein